MSGVSTALARSHTVALRGLQGIPVQVECHIGPGIVGVTLVGLADTALREAKERVRAALASIGVKGVNRRVTVNLSPSGLPKRGSGFDLAIAVSLLVAQKRLDRRVAEQTVFVSELGLDGSLRPVAGILSAALAARDAGFTRIVVAPQVAEEAGLVPGLEVVACASLADLARVFDFGLAGRQHDTQLLWDDLASPSPAFQNPPFRNPAFRDRGASNPGLKGTGGEDESGSVRPGEGVVGDIADVRGQPEAVQALALAAVGAHHVLLRGPQGVGKTMLATRLSALLPDLDAEDALAATALRSLAQQDAAAGGSRRDVLVKRPPVEVPHHSATAAALVGGGVPVRPGAVSLAHGGVLVLDEAPEFNVRALEALRQPLENGEVAIYRAKEKITFPARFQMVMTANPCPCGGGVGQSSCICSFAAKKRYWSRLSGPLLDRVDMSVGVGRPHRSDLEAAPQVDPNELRDNILEARGRTRARLKHTPWRFNAEVPGRFLRDKSNVSAAYLRTLDRSIDKGEISLRGADRVLRVAWSSADLAGRAQPAVEDLALASQLRGGKGLTDED